MSGKKKQDARRRIEEVQERTKNKVFYVDLKDKDRRLYTMMSAAGYAAYLVGVGLYIWKMFTIPLGDLRYAVFVVAIALGIGMSTGFAEVMKEMTSGDGQLKAAQVTKGIDRITNLGMASGQIFLAVFLMELLSRSSMPRWIPAMSAIGALICYSGGKTVSEAVKEVKKNTGKGKKEAKGDQDGKPKKDMSEIEK